MVSWEDGGTVYSFWIVKVYFTQCMVVRGVTIIYISYSDHIDQQGKEVSCIADPCREIGFPTTLCKQS